jgi:hypothetical protein
LQDLAPWLVQCFYGHVMYFRLTSERACRCLAFPVYLFSLEACTSRDFSERISAQRRTPANPALQAAVGVGLAPDFESSALAHRA